MLKQAYDDWMLMQEEAEQNWHGRMQNIYLQLEKQIIMLGGSVKMTEERFDLLSPLLQQALIYNSFKKRTNAEREKIFHLFSKFKPSSEPLPQLPVAFEKKVQSLTFFELCQYVEQAKTVAKRLTKPPSCKGIQHVLSENVSIFRHQIP